MTTHSPDAPSRDVVVQLAHGYLQLLADDVGADILHVKGPAVDCALLAAGNDGKPASRFSTDADVLVRPSHVRQFVDALAARDWQRVTGFEQGSAFGHAMNLRHVQLGNVDLHRRWPGFEIDAERAFEHLWAQRGSVEIAHTQCVVPSVAAQRLLLLLHAGRSGGLEHRDARLWSGASDAEQSQVRDLAATFEASVALAAGIGELEEFRGHPSYQLWSHFGRNDVSRLNEWRGRWNAARGLRGKARVARGFVALNPDLLRERVGPNPTARDYVEEYRNRIGAAGQDLWRVLREVRIRRPKL